MPSIFMPRYFLATLMLFAIPAAAAAAYAESRTNNPFSHRCDGHGRGIAVHAIPCCHAVQRDIRPGAAIEYFRTGDEERLFTFDQTVSAFLCSKSVGLSPAIGCFDSIYPRLWLRADLLAAMSKSAEMADPQICLPNVSPSSGPLWRNANSRNSWW